MNISAIGHIAKDVFHIPANSLNGDEQTVESYGGILYSVATLANLLSKEDKVTPIFGVVEQEYDALIELLERYGNIETHGIFKLRGETNTVHIFPGVDGNQIECSKHIAPPIPFARIKPYLDVDGVLINMASGFDITLETLDYVRMQIRDKQIPVHLDVHSLTMGIDKEYTRFRRSLTDWRRWCFMVNSIQMNEQEAAGFTSERYNEETLINQLMPLMVNALLLTRGERGVTLIRQEHKKISYHEIAGIEVNDVVSTIGCGDVFGAAFFYEHLTTHDFVKAAEFGNNAAASKAKHYGIEGLTNLKAYSNSQVQTG